MEIYKGKNKAPGVQQSGATEDEIETFGKEFYERYAHEPEFEQAHKEVFESLKPVFLRDARYLSIFKMLSEPERIVCFRVLWEDDEGAIQLNRGYRIQFNSAIGPYKGGLRLSPEVNLSVLKFLGFEQILKNSLTGLNMGGAKGGSDFDPKGKSDREVRRFCQAFMTELSRHIGPETDVPAGDIGTGAREIGFMYGQYHKLNNCHHGVLTGKGLQWGGSRIRPEATGYGAVYYAEELFKKFEKTGLKGRRCLVSGAGNAAQYTCQKLIELKAKFLSVSDSCGTLMFPEGMTEQELDAIMELKNVQRGRLSVMKIGQYKPNEKPWTQPNVDCEIAFPSATQNELDEKDAEALLRSAKFRAVVEVANMPTTAAAVHLLRSRKTYFCPGKAANAGGVAVSGLEMSQNAAMVQWSTVQVDEKLREIMDHIFTRSVECAVEYGLPEHDLLSGANIAGFLRVADAMIEQGLY